jgi:predicted NBD/HSP70 family sugar kinase
LSLGRDDIGQRSETVRRANLSAIVRELHERGPLSRSELVARTGLTRSAIRGLIGELVGGDLVSEERAEPLGTPGRPSPLVSPNPDGAVVLALEIAVDSLAAVLVGLGGSVFRSVRVDRPRGHSSVEDIVADLAALAAEVTAGRPDNDSIIGVGVSMVGIVRRSDGFVSRAPNLGWFDAPLGAELARALRTSLPISVANDGDLGALVEHRRGSARGADDVLYVAGEVGVGGGLIVDGKPLTGVAGYSGEIGHLPMNPAGATCRCGSVGCWETEIGEEALLVRAGFAPDGGSAAVDAVLQAAEGGSVSALEALDHVGHWLGVGLAGLVNLLNPRVIVLGGLFSRIHPNVGRAVELELDRRALAAPRSLVRVVPATFGVDAPVLGAAELAFEPLLADPSSWLGPRVNSIELASA